MVLQTPDTKMESEQLFKIAINSVWKQVFNIFRGYFFNASGLVATKADFSPSRSWKKKRTVQELGKTINIIVSLITTSLLIAWSCNDTKKHFRSFRRYRYFNSSSEGDQYRFEYNGIFLSLMKWVKLLHFSLNYHTSLSLSSIHVLLKYMRNTFCCLKLFSSRQNQERKRERETNNIIVLRIIIKVCSQCEPTKIHCIWKKHCIFRCLRFKQCLEKSILARICPMKRGYIFIDCGWRLRPYFLSRCSFVEVHTVSERPRLLKAYPGLSTNSNHLPNFFRFKSFKITFSTILNCILK